MNEILLLVLTGVGSLLGALIGTRLATHQYKEQRAYDRRLDWYERMFRVSNDFIDCLHDVKVSDAKGETPEANPELDKKMDEIVAQYKRIAAEASLYAHTGGKKAISDVYEGVYRWVKNDQAPFDEMIELVKTAAETLAIEARSEFFPGEAKGKSLLRM